MVSTRDRWRPPILRIIADKSIEPGRHFNERAIKRNKHSPVWFKYHLCCLHFDDGTQRLGKQEHEQAPNTRVKRDGVIM